ncbi:hypothetical protein RJ640_019169 [Escallonia rubra]|uniref:Uncharacterized protein n=1 Tax=Escallonia rubra TaxID=112253 RepID=A0AA88R391_9ASTE|nr:hypothetical protein RJ640_019169 [Escallonia rubra]
MRKAWEEGIFGGYKLRKKGTRENKCVKRIFNRKKKGNKRGGRDPAKFVGFHSPHSSDGGEMKGTCTLVASVLAASAVALTSSTGDHDLAADPCSSERKRGNCSSQTSSSEKGKFAPRFDGLRFIETLVTAHR